MRIKLFVVFLLAFIFVTGCTESDPKLDPKEQAKQVATDFKEKQYKIKYEEIADLDLREALRIIDDRVKPLLTKHAFDTNTMVNNFRETVDVSILTKSNLSLKNIEFEFKEKTDDTYIFDYNVEVFFEKYNDDILTETESITGEVKVTNTEDGFLVSNSTQTHFPLKHIEAIQKKFGVPVGYY
ncbi:hypothetical protein LG329_08540 [Virgibacillus necropolis]|uniref:hypothetical protein n=1 Tax=Virgibacillus necropolis TaxID=163877 RepID=UPI00384C10BD